MLNTGGAPLYSRSGLSASIGFACGGALRYVLEGNVTCCGDTLCWLRDELGLLARAEEAEALAKACPRPRGSTWLHPF